MSASHSTSHSTAYGVWGAYLDAVEAGALALREQLAAGEPAAGELAAVPDVDPPAGEPPLHAPGFVARRDAVAALVAEVLAELEQTRDDVAAKLRTLSHRHAGPSAQGRAYGAQTLGQALDLVG